jgi:5-methyltetrahydropteroyltriglutamate--homocysteine methyltransferase
MIRSTDRIRATHVGSLARPRALLDLMKAAAEGRPVDPAELAETERKAVADVAVRQRAAGLDMISDGEQTKTGFYAYIGQRLSGFEPRPGRDPLEGFRAEIDSFPEYYEQYLTRAMTGGMAAPAVPLACTGPVSYTGDERLRRDLDLLREAVGQASADEVFVCAVAPSGVGGDRIVRFAGLVGRENVAASADCGFASQASYTPEIHPTIVWAKFEALAEGARRATARLW